MWRSPWTSIVLAVVIAGLLALAGKWSTSALVALLVFVILGAIVPPVAIAIGGVAAFYLVITNGVPVFAKIRSDLQQQGGQASG